ncbi:DNA mismatch repair endonuclease MutL [Saprospira grandis]|uniref:DNA mismatch repair protein MutL n=1 Tax=Saprospira grandis (strain Lewin) TaxID=984262 RepID=H6LAP0_SAPGL|nr:DNA mismatch repair endonuclease MutL [Saprospira grandis]AFC25633.1 DNA mismatch repair protein [Saprospira grandis str. Lewin]
MADLIRLLPDHIANQIAAGEVVQRPASVVKELMENAIDAGAQNIRLIINDAGKTLIQLVDDGIGMSETDARMSFERHATSKIQKAEDLFNLHTMGFRGEALASIAAVAQVEMRTKKRGEELGVRLQVEGSELILQEPCQAAAGTSISVKNLFYNIPARRNFLKSDKVEFKHILDEFQQIAIAHPDIFFALHHNGQKQFHLPASNLKQRIIQVLGKKYAQALIPISEETDIIKIWGYVGKPDFARKMRGDQYFYVNQRYIKSNYLQHALFQAYEDLLPQKMYPLYVVFFELDPAKIDVNVHPSKQEIKFEDERLIYNYLRVCTRHALAQHHVTPSIDFDQESSISKQLEREQMEKQQLFSNKTSSPKSTTSGGGGGYRPPQKTEQEKNNLAHWEKLYAGLQNEEEEEQQPLPSKLSKQTPLFEQEEEETLQMGQGPKQELFYLGQGYMISPLRAGYLLIHQQTALERILYDDYLQRLEHKRLVQQHSLFPISVSLNLRDAKLLQELLPELKKMGFELVPMGETTFVISSVPAYLEQLGEEDGWLEEILEQYQLGQSLSLSFEQNMARAMAMRMAKQQPKRLSPMEMQALIDRLFACQNPERSPRGRRCFIRYNFEELDSRFES